jgi:hypothetical protein
MSPVSVSDSSSADRWSNNDSSSGVEFDFVVTNDDVEFLRPWQGGSGEHGAHALVLGADNMLYSVCGNFVGVPTDLAPSSPHRNYGDDLALKRMEDGNGFGAGAKPPGGYVLRLAIITCGCRTRKLFSRSTRSANQGQYASAVNAEWITRGVQSGKVALPGAKCGCVARGRILVHNFSSLARLAKEQSASSLTSRGGGEGATEEVPITLRALCCCWPVAAGRS